MNRKASCQGTLALCGLVALTLLHTGCCKSPAISGPTPGPIIDIIDEPGTHNLTYNVNRLPIAATNSVNPPRLDSRFFHVVTNYELNDTGTFENSHVENHRVDFTDARFYTATKQSNGKIEWKCGSTVVQEGNAADGIPACMLGTVDASKIKSTRGMINLDGDWGHIEMQP